MLIAVAGPYSAETIGDRQRNLDAMNQAAAEVFRRGHIPVIGVNVALPVVELFPEQDRYAAIMAISLAVVDRCDAILMIGELPALTVSAIWFARRVCRFTIQSARFPHYRVAGVQPALSDESDNSEKTARLSAFPGKSPIRRTQMKNILLTFSLLLLTMWFSSQTFAQATGAKPPGLPEGARIVGPDIGHLKGVNYVNDFFGLSFSIPGDWIVVQGRNKEIAESSKKVVANEEAKKRAEYERSIEQSTILLGLNRVPSGAPNNASLLVIAERLSSPAIKNGVDALRSMEKMTTNTSFLVQFQDGIRSETINGVEFGVATIKTTSGTVTFAQKVYMMIKNGYALEFFFTYQDPVHVATFDRLMNTVKIK